MKYSNENKLLVICFTALLPVSLYSIVVWSVDGRIRSTKQDIRSKTKILFLTSDVLHLISLRAIRSATPNKH